MTSQNEEVLQLKEKGNQCVREAKFEEAILHYTTAIKLDPNNATLYSNRSLAFLKIQQHYYAHSDALETIRLKPNWAKGYFRKGEVELSAYQATEALISYGIALRLQPTDQTIVDSVGKASALLEKEKRDEQTPWVGAGIGIILGVTIIIGDQLFTVSPSISHPILMVLLTISISALGYGIALAWRYHINCQRKALLEPPVDLLEEAFPPQADGTIKQDDPIMNGRSHIRLSKAKARAKLRRAKT